MVRDAEQEYADIIHLSRPVSRHPKMAEEDRAKIFAPFSALMGYEEAVEEKERVHWEKMQR